MAKVNYIANQEDFQTALLGSLGFSTELIAIRTGLSVSQVQYRLSKAQIYRRTFRNGGTPVASILLRTVGQRNNQINRTLRDQLTKLVAENGHKNGKE